MIKLGYDVATKAEVRKGIWDAIKNITPGSAVTMIKEAVKGKIADYNFSDKPWKGYHTVGKDGVTVVTAIMGFGLVKQGENALKNGVENVGEQVEQNVKKRLKNYLEKALEKQKNYLKKVKSGEIELNDNFRKGNFGEMATDVDLTEKGFKPLLINRVTDIDAPPTRGIDGVFEKNGEYYIVESKYSGTSRLTNTSDDLQMSDRWINGNDRLLKAVGKEMAKEIDAKRYKRILSEVAPDGKITYKLLKDQEGKIFEIINL